MVKRFSWNSYIYLFFALLILMVSWEHNRTLAAVLETDIPEESIRLRILAHSDSIQDQVLKRRVRDAIVEQMNSWVSGPTTLDEARIIVSSHISELEAVVDQEIRRYGYDYTYKVELGMVPFPAKMYGNRVYPAGDYEALRVTIGAGAGQNWWCVLFPPLCFVDAAKGEAVEKDTKADKASASNADRTKRTSSKKEAAAKKDDKALGAGGTAKAKSSIKAETEAKKAAINPDSVNVGADSQDGADGVAKKKKVRFYFWEKVKGWFA